MYIAAQKRGKFIMQNKFYITGFTALIILCFPLNAMEEDACLRARQQHFDMLLKELSVIQEIYDFDPNILGNNYEEENFAPSKNISYHFLDKIDPFYSEDAQNREQAFAREIMKPVLSILKRAADKPYYCHKPFSAVAQEAETSDSQGLINIAIKDIFKDSKYGGLMALKDALQLYRDKGRLSDKCHNNLCLLRKIAGYHFDPRAIAFIINLNRSLTVPQSRMGKLAFLRILQIQGELFKFMLPSTLNLASLPSEELLKGLRDELSHLSRQKLNRLLESDSDDLFIMISKDINTISEGLSKILEEYDKRQAKAPSELWNALKELPEQRVSDCLNWDGISQFNEILKVEKNPQEHQNQGKMGDYSRKPESYIKKASDSLANIKPNLTKDEFLAKYRQCMSELIKNSQQIIEKRRDDDEAYEIYQNPHKNREERVIELIGIPKESYYNHMNSYEKNSKTKQYLLKAIQHPNNGCGKLSDKYEKFCERWKTAGGIDCFRPFDWLAEPDEIEQIFYEANNIEINSLIDKKKIRQQRIEQILGIIEIFRALFGISTNLNLEIEKDSFKTFVLEKRVILEKWRKYLSIGFFYEFYNEAKKVKPDLLLTDFMKFGENSLETPKEIDHIINKMTKIYKIIKDSLENFDDNLDYYSFDGLPGNYASQITNAQDNNALNLLRDSFNKRSKEIYDKYIEIFSNIERIDLSEDLQHEFANGKLCDKRLFIAKMSILKKVQENYRSNVNNSTLVTLLERLRSNEEERMACEFFIASIYECLKEISDYPELQMLEYTDLIRNYFFHTDLSGSETETFTIGRDVGIIYNHKPGIAAKEAVILAINIKAILEDLLLDLK